jgi:hypothetical protein
MAKSTRRVSSCRSAVKVFFTASSLVVSGVAELHANPQVSDRSPDKKYALWQEYAEKQPYHGDVKLIDAKSGQAPVVLDIQVEPFSKKLCWAKDSQRVAYFNDAEKGGVTRVFFRNATGFGEVKLPDLPAPALPAIAASKNEASETRTRVEPLRWTDSGELVIEKEFQNNEWGRAALEITVAFDAENRPSIAKSEQEPPSIVDYFLLLPKDYFEGPPSIWLRSMRESGGTIDKKNGFMYCAGDGAQPEFEVALFRYRDGRPLLAMSGGELEGADNLYFRFFEPGPNGKMQVVNHWMFPVPDGGYDPESGAPKANWEFILPRTGRTILIRTAKGHKVLHKLTWKDDRFEKDR